MHSNQQFSKNVLLSLANKTGYRNMHNFPPESAFGTALPSGEKQSIPFHGVAFQPSEVCPKNFIIFDQTDNRSQIMFHPAIANKLSYPGLNMHATFSQDNTERKVANNEERETSFPSKEDSDDIDALLSLEEEQEDYDEEEVSTARTNGNFGNSSPDSCSTYGSKHRKIKLTASIQKSSSNRNSCSSESKRMKLKKMVNILRGMVPGGNQMDTVAVLDEAVRYLKSLKVEVQNKGVRESKD